MANVILSETIKKYGSIEVIHGIDLKIEDGEFCVFVGPSGCGKSTLLRMISGLENTTSGNIYIGSEDVTNVDASDRGVAMVFQSYALYPHMTVRENMGFGLKMNKTPKDEIIEKVNKATEILKLEPYLDRKPKALSGGQRQRVAIGRAIVRGPEVFLFDEPLSNLDAELRLEMRVELARLHKELGTTMIYVTHDQVEAMTLADKIVVLNDGIVEQVGTPMELYSNPKNRFVAGFIGSPAMNFFELTNKNDTLVSNQFPDIAFKKINGFSKVIAGIRPNDIKLKKSGNMNIDLIEELGGVTYLYLSGKDNLKLVVEHREKNIPKLNAKVGLKIKEEDLLYFDKETGKRI
ncbi:sn-glycerol-3-phosphate ABC transporter ATP-binding protein UgpC [Amylibacter sp.]|jgi:lactose/L-arabinose transport system ATP-binding protein|nr:sn-glycerol-3-phosphate ABC transporter ATP-binding protein UgpC [Amylibacter sp.]|tara:strand:- start:1396 stop:2439 length:1044 start_codon:yes stop_codon:yes gene_type:complete